MVVGIDSAPLRVGEGIAVGCGVAVAGGTGDGTLVAVGASGEVGGLAAPGSQPDTASSRRTQAQLAEDDAT
jgi:hypothetical protein